MISSTPLLLLLFVASIRSQGVQDMRLEVIEHMPFTVPKARIRHIDETLPTNSLLGILELQQINTPPGGKILCETSSEYFRIIAMIESHQSVRLAKQFDRETKDKELVEIVCTLSWPNDESLRPLVVTYNFTIIVEDVNDNSPEFTNNPDVTVMLTENVEIGHFVTRVSAVDLDLGENARIEYEIISMDEYENWILYPEMYEDEFVGHVDTDGEEFEDVHYDENVNETDVYGKGSPISVSPFRIDKVRGDIFTNDIIDRESTAEILVAIKAIDFGPLPLAGVTRLRIVVGDVNDNMPIITSTKFHVKENQPGKTLVGQLKAVDQDEGRNAEVVFSVLDDIENSASDQFIVKKDGRILTTMALDRETKGQYDLVVLAKDRGKPRLSSTSTVTIIVDDVNDNDPVVISRCLGDPEMLDNVFTGEENMGEMEERDSYERDSYAVSDDSSLHTSEAKSWREVEMQEFEKQMMADDMSEAYAYNADKERDAFADILKTIRINSSADATTTSSYGPDSGATTLSSIGKRVLKSGELILDWAIPDDERPVYKIMATDADSGNNGVTYYSISTIQVGGGDDMDHLEEYGSVFKIDSMSGEIFLRRHVLVSDPSAFILNVSVRDGGNPSRSAHCLLNVTLDVEVTHLTPPPSTEGVMTSSSLNSTDAASGMSPMCIFSSSSLVCVIACVTHFVEWLHEFGII